MTYFITSKTQGDTKIRVLGTAEKRDVARGDAARLGGTVRTQADIDALINADRLDRTTLPGYVSPEPIINPAPAPIAPDVDAELREQLKEFPVSSGRWNEMAAGIAAAHKKATTIGKKDRTPKRPPTDAAVLAEAAVFIRAELCQADVSKVQAVRELADWQSTGGVKLHRGDAIKLLGEALPGISPATVSTQWQLVRAGKLVKA
jgi:hypothetical protein